MMMLGKFRNYVQVIGKVKTTRFNKGLNLNSKTYREFVLYIFPSFDKANMSIEKLLKLCRFLSFMKLYNKVTILAGMGAYLDGFDLIVISAAISLISVTFNITSSSVSGLLIGTAFLGGFFGALFLGKLVDKYGRRIMFLTDLFLFVGGTLITALSVNLPMIFVGRALVGLAIGADISVSWTMVAEYSPKNRRGALLSYQFILWGLGAISSYLILFAVLSAGNMAWRIAFLIGLIPAVLVLIMRRSIPESPRWLISHGKENEAFEILKTNDITLSKSSISALEIESKDLKDSTTMTLFSRKYIRLSTGVFIAQFLAFFIVIPANLYTPKILLLVGFSKQFSILLLGSAFVWIFNVLGFLGGSLLLDKIGRRNVAGFAFIPLAAILLTLWITITYINIDVFFLLWILVEFLSAFGASVTWAWSSELFPTAIRGFAMGFNGSANRLIGFFGSYILAVLLAISLKLVYLTCFIIGIGLVFVVMIWINVEAKGKDLEDISELRTEGVE